jgi:hypothetical protein
MRQSNPTAAEKAMAETTAQLRRYRASLQLRRAELLAGPHGRQMQELLAIVDDPSATPALLVNRIASATWLSYATSDFRHVVLAILAGAISEAAVRNGRPPFNDALPGDPPTAFQQLRKLLVASMEAAQ